MLALARTNIPWLFTLQPGSDFYDHNFHKADTIPTSASFGLAIACDNDYIWATQANEVWRSKLPGSWDGPDDGSGAGSGFYLNEKHILHISESIEPEQESTLTIELDNSKGDYDNPGSGDLQYLKRGGRVQLYLGYATSQGSLTEQTSRYFISSWEYDRSPRKASFIIHCTDAWGLAQRYTFNAPVQWNMTSNDYSVYTLISMVLSAIDVTLSYKSRSSLITSLYPRFDVHAGESGATVLSRLLRLVPDVIFFYGNTAYIVHPQSGDTAVYGYRFPLL